MTSLQKILIIGSISITLILMALPSFDFGKLLKTVRIVTKTNPIERTQSKGEDVIDVGSSPLSGISKEQVERLAVDGGTKAITLTHPILSPDEKNRLIEGAPADINPETAMRDTTSEVFAGTFVGTVGDNIFILKQGTREQQIYITAQSRLWSVQADKQQIVSDWVPDLIRSGVLSQYLHPDDLVLAMYVNTTNNQFQARWFVVFQ